MRRERFRGASEVPRGRGSPGPSIRRRKVDGMRTATAADVFEAGGLANVGATADCGRSLRR